MKKFLKIIIIIMLMLIEGIVCHTLSRASPQDLLFSGMKESYLSQAEVEEAMPPGDEEAEKYLTRGEAARLLTATDFLKKKIGQLLSWSIGYDISALNRAKLVPSIKYIKAQPIKVPPDGRTVLSLLVAVDDPGGLGNISGVRVDFSSIGQLPNMALVDNGLWGDFKAGDGIYTIQTNVKPDVTYGKKEIPIAVANRKGWLTLSKTSLDVEGDPSIIWTKATPASVRADGKSKVLLEVAVDNPGGIEDIKSVTVDLSSIGGEKDSPMRNDGTAGDKKPMDNVFTLEVVPKAGVSPGEKKLPVKVVNIIERKASGEIILVVTRE